MEVNIRFKKFWHIAKNTIILFLKYKEADLIIFLLLKADIKLAIRFMQLAVPKN